MKQLILILIFVTLSINTYSKEYDLIVKANGDSIACYIDSITSTHIYFKMKNRSEWISTHINKSEIRDYQPHVIHKKSVHFIKGTSYIRSSDQLLPTKVAIKAGFGLAELLNIGLRFQSDKFKIGLSTGFIPSADRTIFSISGDIYLPLGHAWRESNKQPWCARAGLTYLREESEKIKDTFLLLNLRAGRDILISNKLGIEFYFGLMFRIYYDHIIKEQYWDLGGYDGPVLPSGGIGIFYTL